MAAHLPQLQKRIQHHDLRPVQPVRRDRLAHSLVHGCANRLIKVRLFLPELNRVQNFRFRRQLLRHRILRAPQQQRLDSCIQLLLPVRICIPFNRIPVMLPKGIRIT